MHTLDYGNTFILEVKISSKKDISHLPPVEKTLLIPLWARAEETKQGGIISDTESVKLVDFLDIDKYKLDELKPFIKNYLLASIANRTILIDNFLNKSIDKESIVLNIGCGLDTRYKRYCDKFKHWYDIDLAHVIELRKEFIDGNENYTMLSGGILNDTWIKNIPPEDRAKVVIIVEGVLMYFSETQVKEFFQMIQKNFSHGSIIFESLGSFATMKKNPVLKNTGGYISYIWTINNPKEIENLISDIRYVDHRTIFDINKKRWGLFGKLIYSNKYLLKRTASKITLVEF